MTPIPVGTIQNWIDMGRLEPPKDGFLTMKDIVDAGIVNATKVKHGIKLMGQVKDKEIHMMSCVSYGINYP